MIDRRGFLKLLGLAAAAYAVPVPTAVQVYEESQKHEEFQGLTYDSINDELMKVYPPGTLEKMFHSPSPFRMAMRRTLKSTYDGTDA